MKGWLFVLFFFSPFFFPESYECCKNKRVFQIIHLPVPNTNDSAYGWKDHKREYYPLTITAGFSTQTSLFVSVINHKRDQKLGRMVIEPKCFCCTGYESCGYVRISQRFQKTLCAVLPQESLRYITEYFVVLHSVQESILGELPQECLQLT